MPHPMESQQVTRSRGLQRPDDPGQDVREGVSWKGPRLSPGTLEATEDTPVTMPTTASAVRDSSPPPNNARYSSYIAPSWVSQYARRPSQQSPEEQEIFHLPSRHGASVAGGIQTSSGKVGASGDLAVLNPSVAPMVGAARVAHCFSMSYVAGNSTAPAQASIAVNISSSRVAPGACGRPTNCATVGLRGFPYNTLDFPPTTYSPEE